MVALISSILILILDMLEQFSLIDETKKKIYKHNLFCQKMP